MFFYERQGLLHVVQDGISVRCQLAAAGVCEAAFESPKAAYFAPRFTVPVPDTLVLRLMPFIAELREYVAINKVRGCRQSIAITLHSDH